MALTKSQKTEVIKELEASLANAETMVFVNFKGLTVAEVNKLRKALREAGASYKVAKKTLLGRVLDSKNIEGTMPAMEGEIAVVYSTDALAPAREVFNFAKGKETPTIVGGVFAGEYADKARMLSIATIPSREVLLAQFVNLINSPIQRFAVVLSEIAKTKTA
jgi:large subunit ribosomal protein L10